MKSLLKSSDLGIEIRTEIYSEEANEDSIDDASRSFEDSYQEALNDYLSEAIQILTVYSRWLERLTPSSRYGKPTQRMGACNRSG